MAEKTREISVERAAARQRDLMQRFWDFMNERDPFSAWPMSRMFGEEGTIVPKLDVAETAEKLEVSVELPGMDEKDVEVSVQDGVLTIKGEKKSETEEKDKTFHRVERSYGSFSRSFTLPPNVDDESGTADFKKGVLTVNFKKTKEPDAESKRKIEIKSSAP